MNFAFSPEQEEFRQSLRRFLADKSPAAEVRRLMETDAGYDPQVWKQLADQLGLQGLAIPEEFGGAGATPVELGIAFEEMGRALLCAPFFSTVGLAAQALLAAGDDQAKREYLPRIADGSLLATVAVTEADGRWDLAAVRTSAVADSAGSPPVADVRGSRRSCLTGPRCSWSTGISRSCCSWWPGPTAGSACSPSTPLTPASCAPCCRRLT